MCGGHAFILSAGCGLGPPKPFIGVLLVAALLLGGGIAGGAAAAEMRLKSGYFQTGAYDPKTFASAFYGLIACNPLLCETEAAGGQVKKRHEREEVCACGGAGRGASLRPDFHR